MNFKPSFSYQLTSFVKPVIIFASIYAAIILVTIIATRITTDMNINKLNVVNDTFVSSEDIDMDDNSASSTISTNGMEFSVIIFTFVMGLASYKEMLKFFFQNGTSRNTMFFGKLTSALTYAAGITIGGTLLDKLLGLICQLLSTPSMRYVNWNMYQGSVFYGRSENISEFQYILEGMLLFFSVVFMIYFIGTFITSLMYRLNALGKTLVSIGTVFFMIIIIPYLNSLTGGIILKTIGNVLNVVLGIESQNPLIPVLFVFLTAFVFAGFSYLLIRRAPIKK